MISSFQQIDFLAPFDLIDLNARNNNKETALHIMVKRSRLSPLISLICHGADINATNETGETPLHYSAKVIDLLIDNLLKYFFCFPNYLYLANLSNPILQQVIKLCRCKINLI